MLMGRDMDRKPRDPMEGLYHVFFMTEATRVTPDRLEGGATHLPSLTANARVCKCPSSSTTIGGRRYLLEGMVRGCPGLVLEKR